VFAHGAALSCWGQLGHCLKIKKLVAEFLRAFFENFDLGRSIFNAMPHFAAVGKFAHCQIVDAA
jgi:hypothetical protein